MMVGLPAIPWVLIGGFLKKHWQVFVILGAMAVMSATFLGYGSLREQAGVSKTELRVERTHTETIKQVRDDEQLAQKVSDALGNKLAAKQEADKSATDQTLKDIQDELAKRVLAPGAVADVVSDGVRNNSNSLVDRANREADDPGAAPAAAAEGTP